MCGATGCDCLCEGCSGLHACSRRHLHLCVCRACRFREEVQATSHHWAAEAVSLSARRGKQLFLQAMCWSASILPTGYHFAVSLQCNSRAPHCTRGPLSLGLFAAPWPAVPHWEAAQLFLYAVEKSWGSSGGGDGDVFPCEWFGCALLLCCLSAAVVCCFPPRRKLLPSANRHCEIVRL
ncbi:hypothetical protein TcCL_ESM02926 [Trypanosoma cruzi]|nr:hypothetical protein TcCL_ESM02926 [Trypanosoma cruzi]